jgi:hypothetical protein
LNFQQKTDKSYKIVEKVSKTEKVVKENWSSDGDTERTEVKDKGKAGRGIDEDIVEYGTDGTVLVDINAVKEIREIKEIPGIKGWGSSDMYSSENRIVEVKGIMDAKLREIEKLKKSVTENFSEIDASREENLDLRQKLEKLEPEN